MAIWNEALTAFDRRAELLEGLRDEYVAFMKELVGSVDTSARAALGDDLDHWIDQADRPGLMGRWRPVEESPLTVSSWATGPYGGPAGELAVSLAVRAVDMGKIKNKNEKAQRQRRFQTAFAAGTANLPGAPVDPANPPEDVDTVGVLRLARMPIEPTSPAIVIEYLRAAKELHRRVRSCLWLEEALSSLPGETLPESAPAGAQWESDALAAWEGGRYVQIDESTDGERSVWIAGLPPGSLVLGHSGGAAVHAELCRRLGVTSVRISQDDPSNFEAELLDEHTVLGLHERNDAEQVRAVARQAFAAYFEVARP